MKCSPALFLGLSAVASYPTRANGICTVNGVGVSTNTDDRITFSGNGNSVICTNPSVEDDGGCVDADIVGCDDVHCGDSVACWKARVTATTVRCTGFFTCHSSIINAMATVDCDRYACVNATITMVATESSTPPVVTCTGSYSCEDASVDAGPSGIIVCSNPGGSGSGVQACTGSIIGSCVQCLDAASCSSTCQFAPDSTTQAIDCSVGTCPTVPGVTIPSTMKSGKGSKGRMRI
jgi:hypothetical protein